MNRQESIALFNSMHPGFFERGDIRELPEGEVFEEMLLNLREFDSRKASASADVSFGFFEGDVEELRKAVALVIPEWTEYFGEGGRVFCGFSGGEIASFCLVDDMGIHSVNGDTLKIGGPGCVGTVPEYRNRGIGLEMVRLATLLLKDEGFDYSYIHYTAVAPWYAKLGYSTILKWSRDGII